MNISYKTINIVFSLAIASLFFFGGLNAYGQGSGASSSMGIDLTISDLESMLRGMVCFIYRIAGLLIIIFITVTGIKYLISSGNPDKIKAVNESFKWVIIGSLVILGFGVIIATISAAVGGDPLIPIVC